MCYTPGEGFHERWIGSIRRELLDRTLVWNQHQLDRLVVDYIEHYNLHRPHRSLDQQPPLPADPLNHPGRDLRVLKSTRCDGLIHEYRNTA
ncbi:MAG: transposase [Actinomycetia bacterium]|nr:transposase [Actinomycetes bacterium]MCP4087417.1 transposase [Actinomycetes bacterium]